MSTRASAVVTVAVVVETSAAWGGDCTIEQVRSQAEEDARARVQRVLGGNSGMQVNEIVATRVVIMKDGK